MPRAIEIEAFRLDGGSLTTSSIRVLVVDDFEPFRRFVALTLQERPELEIICEASDGLDAVQKAEELRPDVVLLDIGLPKLNGIEVALRIRELSPQSAVLFVSQESCKELSLREPRAMFSKWTREKSY
jgi:DNA-binding NarL/FixJ family response regulator